MTPEEIKETIKKANDHHSKAKEEKLKAMRESRKKYFGTAFLNLSKDPCRASTGMA
jgi:hypothetical protein